MARPAVLHIVVGWRAYYVLTPLLPEALYRRDYVVVTDFVSFLADFFYYYVQSWRNNEKLSLPA